MINTLLAIGGTVTTLGLGYYSFKILAMTRNLQFQVIGVRKKTSDLSVGAVIRPEFEVTTQISNPSRTSAYVRGMLLNVYAEVRPGEFTQIGTINEPNINTTLESRDNSFITTTLQIDTISLGKLVINGFGRIVDMLEKGQVPSLRFSGNISVNSIRKKVEFTYKQ